MVLGWNTGLKLPFPSISSLPPPINIMSCLLWHEAQSYSQQLKFADFLAEIFGDTLDTSSVQVQLAELGSSFKVWEFLLIPCLRQKSAIHGISQTGDVLILFFPLVGIILLQDWPAALLYCKTPSFKFLSLNLGSRPGPRLLINFNSFNWYKLWAGFKRQSTKITNLQQLSQTQAFETLVQTSDDSWGPSQARVWTLAGKLRFTNEISERGEISSSFEYAWKAALHRQ